MEIKVLGSSLDQWELGRKIRITPPDGIRIDRAEFCHAGDNETLPVQPYYDDGILVADIPNLFLQSGEPIHAFLVHIEENVLETVASCILSVSKRPKPNEYVYTETEVMSWQALDARMREFMAAVTSAYDIAVKYGYEGTEEEWIAELQGNAAESARLASEAQAKAEQAQTDAEQSAQEAAASAGSASNSAQAAETAKQGAEQAKTNAEASAQTAQTEASKAAESAANANESASEAKQAAQEAKQSANGLEQAEQNAKASEQNAAVHEEAARVLLGQVKNHYTVIKNLNDAAAYHAEYAYQSRQFAEAAQAKASTSETNAKASEEKAKASETSAAASAEEAKKAASVSGGADWNAPEGAPGHVKGRTHWVEQNGENETIHKLPGKFLPDGVPYSEKRMMEIVPETTVQIAEGSQAVLMAYASPSIGDTIAVNWNGTEYSCVCVDAVPFGMPNGVGFGNIGLLIGGADTGEPFAGFIVTDNGLLVAVFMALDGSTEVTISIMGMGEVVHKTDLKFLPELPVLVTFKSVDPNTFTSIMSHTAAELKREAENGKVIFLSYFGEIFIPNNIFIENDNGECDKAGFVSLLNSSNTASIDENGVFTLD